MQENTIKNRFFIPNNDKNCTVSKKVRIETYGCQMNVADSEVVAAMMEMAGYETTENDTEAAAVSVVERSMLIAGAPVSAAATRFGRSRY